MKPTFALDFRDGAVAVLHRTARGWMAVGQTTFDSPDMEEALSFLRSTALGLSPGGVATKLIIPNDQILYASVHAPGPDAAKRRKQIAAALVGRTPYDVADLVFDWWGKGDEVNVAVIARETLAEAEGFAHLHRFNPVSFVAVPDNGVFQGEPWFGMSSVATQILAAGEKVDRDQDPVRIIGRDAGTTIEPVSEKPAPVLKADREPAAPEAPSFTAEPFQDPEAVLNQAPVADPLSKPIPEFGSDLAATSDPITELAPNLNLASVQEPARASEAPIPAKDVRNEDVPASAAAQNPTSADIGRDIAPEPSFPKAAPEAKFVGSFSPEEAEAPLNPADAPAIEDVLAPTFEPTTTLPDQNAPRKTVEIATEEAPMAIDVDEDAADSAPVPRSETFLPPRGNTDAGAAAPSSGFSLLRAFSSRRKEPSAPAPLKAEPTVASLPPVVDRAPDLPPTPPLTASVTAPQIEAFIDTPIEAAQTAAPETSGLAVIGAAGTAARATSPAKMTAERPALARPLPGTAPSKASAGKASKASKGFGAFVTAPSIPGAKGPRAPVAQKGPLNAPSANPSGVSPARPGTRPIGLGARPVQARGKPRFLGLILTGILLVLLALVAAWASFFLAFNEDGAATTNVAAVEQPAAADVPAPEDEMLADMQDPADFTEAEVAGTTGATEEIAAAVDPATDPAAEQQPLEAAPDTGLVAETGAAAVSPAGDAQDEIFLAAIDTPPQPPDPSALGVPAARTDAMPSPAVPPPPFGTVYQFDADGLIIPTPEGIATPEGVLLVAGRPPVVPTSRTPAVVAAVAAAAPSAAVPEAGTPTSIGNPSTVVTDPAIEVPAFADPALKDFRPQPRPAGLQVPSQTGTAEDPTLAPGAGTRFASLRPQARPPAILALAAPPADSETSVDQASIESAVQSASLVNGGAVLPQDRSPLAVSVSRKPETRPKTLQTASVSSEAAVEEVSASAAPAAEADAEPEHEGAMPSLPTSASVAKQATVKNAVNLSKLTLIGIYGSDGRRYALVRQPNGRLVKVKVGDRLDGGKVAAISTSELTYQKGGRALTLELPRT